MHRTTACLLLVLALAGAAPAVRAADAADRSSALRAEIALAGAKKLYLVFCPASGELQLRIQGVVLRRFPATARVAVPRSHPVDWPASTFTLRDGIPQYVRPVVRAPEVGAGEADGGVTPDELVANRNRALEGMPAVYRLRFEPELEVLVRGETGAGVASAWRRFWSTLGGDLSDGAARLTGRPRPLVLVLRTGPEDARRLALALQPEMPLLILP